MATNRKRNYKYKLTHVILRRGLLLALLLLTPPAGLAQITLQVGQGVEVNNVNWPDYAGSLDVAFNNFAAAKEPSFAYFGVYLTTTIANLRTAAHSTELKTTEFRFNCDNFRCQTSVGKIRQFRDAQMPGSTTTIGAGRYYIAIGTNNTDTRYTPAADELGGENHPIVFPSYAPSFPTDLTAIHSSDGVILTWSKGSVARHSSFDVFYATQAGVSVGDNFLRVNPGCAATITATGGECTFTLGYGDLNGVESPKKAHIYFKIRASINQHRSALSVSEAHADPAYTKPPDQSLVAAAVAAAKTAVAPAAPPPPPNTPPTADSGTLVGVSLTVGANSGNSVQTSMRDPEDALIYTWASSNEAVSAVTAISSDGLVTVNAKTPGIAIISVNATDGKSPAVTQRFMVVVHAPFNERIYATPLLIPLYR